MAHGTTMRSFMRDKGVALVEAALVLPILFTLIIGGLFYGLATIDQIRLERTVGDAALLSESEARQWIREIEATMLCYWQGTDAGGCFEDGITIHRTQIVARGRTWHLPTHSVTSRVQVSRPVEGEPSG